MADTSPTIKRCRTAMPPDTGVSDMAGVPRLVLRDVTKLSYVVSDDNTLWYRNADRFIQIKPCKVKVIDVLKDHKFDPNDCKVFKCGSKNCKTCNILITDNSFSSNLTKPSFSTHSFENLSCKSYNIVYAIECTLCGLIYVGETKGELRKRMNGHRSQINNGGNQLLYRHFNLPDHSVLSMKVRILEKIYHLTNKPINSCTPFRRKREEYWIRQLGTAAPYGCNDHIDSIGNLTSPGCQSVNVLNLFDRTSRRHRSHGSRRYNKPEIHNVSFDGLLPFVNLQLGLHHIRTKLYSLPLKTLHVLYESTLTLHFTDVGSPEHRLQGIILDISSNRLFKAVRVCDSIETKNRPFLKIKFANKGIDALNLSNILNHKSVQSNIPPYFEYKESPCISHSYTNSVATKIFNYKTSLQQLDFQSLSQNPLPCSCSGSEFLYAPCGHTSVYDKRDDFGFPIVNFPWLSGDVPRLPSYGIYISQLVRFARCCTSVLDFHSKNLQITSKLLTQGYRYHKLRKTFGKFFRSYSELLSKFGDISFQEYLSKGISHPVFYGDLVYKLRRVKDIPNFILSGSKIVKRLRRRQYDPVIIERTIGLVLGPSTALYEPFLKHCTLTNKAVGTI